jgi:hypothetical protein
MKAIIRQRLLAAWQFHARPIAIFARVLVSAGA